MLHRGWAVNAVLATICSSQLLAGGHQNDHLEEVRVIAEHTRLDGVSDSASRLGLDIGSLPVSADIVTREEMRLYGVRNTREAVETSAGAISGNPPGAPGVFSFRGFSVDDISHLHNGVRIANPGMSARVTNSFNLERVEVLKGPASVLHGEGALVGAINFVTKQPSREQREEEIEVAAGSHDTVRAGYGSGGPTAVDNLYYRIDLSHQQSDGYVDRSGFRYDLYTGTLEYAADSWRVALEVEWSSDDIDAYWGTPRINGELDSRIRRTNYNVFDNIMEQDSYWLRLLSEWQPAAGVQLKNTLYHYGADRHWRNAEDYTFRPDSGMMEVSFFIEILHDQEVLGDRFEALFRHRPFGLDNRFSIGVDVSENRFRHTNNSPFAGTVPVDPFNPSPKVFDDREASLIAAGEDLDDHATKPKRFTNTTTTAVFMEDALQLTPGLTVVAGLRWDNIRVRSEDLQQHADFTKTFDPFTWRLGAVYELSNNGSLYTQYSEAVTPVSTLVTLNASGSEFDLAEGRQYEVGFKQQLSGERGYWTLALFDIRKEDILTRDPADRSARRQIGEQTSRGLELDVAVQLSERWSLLANGSWLDAEFEEFFAAGGESCAGNKPPNVAERVANLTLTRQLGGHWQLGGRGRYVGERSMNDSNELQMDAYATLDLFARWQSNDTELIMRVRNALDELYTEWAIYGDGHLLGDPRSVEVSYSRRF